MNSETIEKIKLYFMIILRLSLIFAIFIEIYDKRWLMLFITILTLIFTYFPFFVEKKYKIDIPSIFEILIVLFIYASIYLGEVRGFYFKIWWWDMFLHFWSAMALGMIGLIIIFIVYEKNKIHAKPFWISLLVFSFAVSIGVLWEIFEFSMDQIFMLNMQKSMLGDESGLTDTMFDLIINSFGALITSIIGYFYIKENKKGYFLRIIEKFLPNY